MPYMRYPTAHGCSPDSFVRVIVDLIERQDICRHEVIEESTETILEILIRKDLSSQRGLI